MSTLISTRRLMERFQIRSASTVKMLTQKGYLRLVGITDTGITLYNADEAQAFFDKHRMLYPDGRMTYYVDGHPLVRAFLPCESMHNDDGGGVKVLE